MEYLFEVRVELKPGVVDAEGETITKALKLLGFPVKSTASVKVYMISLEARDLEEAYEHIENACRRLLANPVIQKYSYKPV